MTQYWVGSLSKCKPNMSRLLGVPLVPMPGPFEGMAGYEVLQSFWCFDTSHFLGGEKGGVGLV